MVPIKLVSLCILNNISSRLRLTNVHMWLGTLERSGVCAHGLNTVAALHGLLERSDNIAVGNSASCAQEWSNGSGENHLDPVEMNEGRRRSCDER